jgi:hypothetical protein
MSSDDLTGREQLEELHDVIASTNMIVVGIRHANVASALKTICDANQLTDSERKLLEELLLRIEGAEMSKLHTTECSAYAIAVPADVPCGCGKAMWTLRRI